MKALSSLADSLYLDVPTVWMPERLGWMQWRAKIMLRKLAFCGW